MVLLVSLYNGIFDEGLPSYAYAYVKDLSFEIFEFKRRSLRLSTCITVQ